MSIDLGNATVKECIRWAEEDLKDARIAVERITKRLEELRSIKDPMDALKGQYHE